MPEAETPTMDSKTLSPQVEHGPTRVQISIYGDKEMKCSESAVNPLACGFSAVIRLEVINRIGIPLTYAY